MRLWSLHPSLLDQKGLVALWRETLLAKAVLENKTKGYKNHSQLVRFKECANPVGAINQYLLEVWADATRRGYNFDHSKIGLLVDPQTITVTSQQLDYEFQHLQNKLVTRDTKQYVNNQQRNIQTADIFNLVEGPIESWEVIK